MRLISQRQRRLQPLLAVGRRWPLVLAGCGCSSKDDDNGADARPRGPCGTTDDDHAHVGPVRHASASRRTGCTTRTRSVCPNITIKEDVVEQSADYWTRLKTRLASGSGLDDVQAIEIGFVADVVQNHADQFVNWNDVPNAAADQGGVLPLEVAAGHHHRRHQHGRARHRHRPEAICYRKDLLEGSRHLDRRPTAVAKDGRPGTTSSPSARSTSVTTKQAGSHFVDSAASIFSTAVYQGDEAYDDADGQPDVENSDGVQAAWGYATQAAAGQASPPGWSSSPTRGTRPSPAARSPPSPAPPG